jgi:hypothetical protein
MPAMLASFYRGAAVAAEIRPVEPDPVRTGEGREWFHVF